METAVVETPKEIRDPIELAEAIKTLLANESLRGTMGAAGSTRAREKFDLAQQACKLEDIYAGLTAQASPSS